MGWRQEERLLPSVGPAEPFGMQTTQMTDVKVGRRGKETGEKRDFSLRRPTLRRSEGERKRWPASFEMTVWWWVPNGREWAFRVAGGFKCKSGRRRRVILRPQTSRAKGQRFLPSVGPAEPFGMQNAQMTVWGGGRGEETREKRDFSLRYAPFGPADPSGTQTARMTGGWDTFSERERRYPNWARRNLAGAPRAKSSSESTILGWLP
jgi:hypothetical protein